MGIVINFLKDISRNNLTLQITRSWFVKHCSLIMSLNSGPSFIFITWRHPALYLVGPETLNGPQIYTLLNFCCTKRLNLIGNLCNFYKTLFNECIFVNELNFMN